MHKCIDVAEDAVWVGNEYIVDCVSPSRCAQLGCFWRKFHGLPREKFSRKQDAQQELPI